MVQALSRETEKDGTRKLMMAGSLAYVDRVPPHRQIAERTSYAESESA
ncbi:hypothetical protein ACVWZK_003709 [Bradyrhizobium sp. GM0.4]|jgi:hypothetical protein|nr:hypothetical protein [Bradyrhizobium canariense]